MRHEKAPWPILTCVTVFAGVILFTGCSSFVPYFSSRSAPVEVEMTQHWDVFAGDVAGQIKLSLENAGIYDSLPMYVETDEESPLANTFRDLLTARLEGVGITVTQEKSDAVFVVKNSIRVICHNVKQVTDPIAGTSTMFVDLPGGVTVARSSGKAPEEGPAQPVKDAGEMKSAEDFPPTEVVITTGVFNDADFLMQKSDIYYVTDPNFWCYAAASQVQEQTADQTSEQISEQAFDATGEEISTPVPEQAPAVVPAAVPAKTSDTGPEPEAPEEISKPLPELKVKGHF